MSSQQEIEIQVVNSVIEIAPTDKNIEQIEVKAEAESVDTVIAIPTEEVFKAYKYRFIILAVYSILSSVFGLLIAVSGPLLTTLQEIYNVDIFMVTLCMALVQYIVYVPSGFLANFILDKYGLRVGVLFGCFFILIGTWVNVLSEHGFYVLFIGNFISAIGQPFIFNAPQLVSSTWFLPQERALSTAIGSTSNLVGCGIGFMISPLFVSEDATGSDGLRQFHKLMQFCAYLASAAVLLNVIFFKNRPPTPPSRSSEASKLTTCQSLKSISKNWNYIIFGVSASLTWGSVNFFGNMVQPMVYPFGISDTKAGTLSAITLGAGLVGALLWAGYVDKSRKFKCSILTCSILTIIFTVVMGAGLFTEKFALLAVATGFMGFFAMPILSLGFELCAELSYPAAEGTAGGLFSLTSNLVSVFGILASDAILKTETKAHSIYTLLLIVGIQVIGFIGFIFFKQDLRRSKAEKESKNDSNKSTASNTSSEENKSDDEKKRFKELLSSSHCELPKEVLSPVVFRSVVSAHM